MPKYYDTKRRIVGPALKRNTLYPAKTGVRRTDSGLNSQLVFQGKIAC